MSVQGELLFSLRVLPTDDPMPRKRLQCHLRSTRPMTAVRWFEGKSIDFALMSLPMLFNVCGRAQAVTLVRAVESALGESAPTAVAQRRQALVKLETLREQVFRVLVDWPAMTGEAPQPQALARVTQGVAQLSEALQPKAVLALGGMQSGKEATQEAVASAFFQAWPNFHDDLSGQLFSRSAEQWLSEMETTAALDRWAMTADTQASRFLRWFDAQPWRDAGAAPDVPVLTMTDEALAGRLEAEREAFCAQPDDRGAVPEMSWFTGLVAVPLKEQLIAARGNGLFTRCACRLLLIARLLRDLSRFAAGGGLVVPDDSTVPGMAHTEAARGRLTHSITLRGDTVERLSVLAPTEWNFHPQGVAAKALEALLPDDSAALEAQAKLLIHAIDPCVGYQLDIRGEPAGSLMRAV
ncbi:MAG: nickel-dependent hydrogenase large subunit [Thiotrichales bacterium]